jgi:regulation of enolase protein 1 (concanavalin A-like superfamily)
VRVQYALAGGPWRMARLTPFPDGPARAGIMACSPERGGFRARFEALELGPPIPRALHD